MQFVIIGLDGIDADAANRRQFSRDAHIEKGEELLEGGNLWYGAALLNDDGTMKGSMYVMNFESEDKMQAYLKTEPYVTGDVWRDITIYRSNTRDPWQYSHDKNWFEESTK